MTDLPARYHIDGGEYSGREYCTTPGRMTLHEIFHALDAVAENALHPDHRTTCTATGHCLELDTHPDGSVTIRNNRAPHTTVTATRQEWRAFLQLLRDDYQPERHTPLTDEPNHATLTRAGRDAVLDYRTIRQEQHPKDRSGGERR